MSVGSQRVTTSVYGSGKGRRLVIHIPGFPPVTADALASVIGKPEDTIRKRLRNWDDPALIVSRGGGGGRRLPRDDGWREVVEKAVAITVLPSDVKQGPVRAPGWGWA